MTGRPVFSGGKVHVKAHKCDTCIFRPGNRMHLQPGRVRSMITESVAEGAGITCHKTIHGAADQEATCRGFYDAFGAQVLAYRLAAALNMIEEVP